jgi:hypothetical protein
MNRTETQLQPRRQDLLRWFHLMRNVTTAILHRSRSFSQGIQQSASNILTHVNVMSTIIRSIESNGDNLHRTNDTQHISFSRRKMQPGQWGNILEDNKIDETKPPFLREKSLLRRQLSNQQAPPRKPPKPDRYQQSTQQQEQQQRQQLKDQLQLFNTESQEMTYRVLELSSFLQEREQGQQSTPEISFDESSYSNISDPLTRFELLSRKLNRDWWSSHSNLLKELNPTEVVVTSGPPLDLEQYDLCLQHFVTFLHRHCHLTRRRSLDLARYFIQLGYFNEFKIKEFIDKYSINWLYDILAKESQDLTNQFIFHEIELISKGLQVSRISTNEKMETEFDEEFGQIDHGDDEWDEKISKIVTENDLQIPTNELLISIQEQLSHLQGNLVKFDHSANNETKFADSENREPENLVSVYERTLHHLMPSIEIPLTPTSLSSPSSPIIQSPSETTPSSDNLQALYAMDHKLTTIISGLYSLYNQIDHMGIHVNQIQSELVKHENMLTSLLTEEYRVPKYAIIIPIEEISLRSFVSVSSLFLSLLLSLALLPPPPPPLSNIS